jgi:2'-hydroxyisoflavone reductase
MRLLVIGGTVFVGRAVVEEALGRGADVTVFHRGRNGAELWAGEVEHVLGDRRTDLGRVSGRSWDLVVDTCGFHPADIAPLDTERYVFVSTAGVYRDWADRPVPGEHAPLHGAGAGYSELTAACERAAEAAMPGRVVHLRPGIILGPHENIGRGPWWLERMARGGRVLAPGPAGAPIQWIDARDLAAFALDAPPGPWNAISAPGAATWGEFLETARDVAGADGTELVWTDGARVAAAVPDSWGVLPLWPAPVPDLAAVYAVGTERALAAGLRIRPLRETLADTWAWLRAPGRERTAWREEVRVTGLDPADERALLER